MYKKYLKYLKVFMNFIFLYLTGNLQAQNTNFEGMIDFVQETVSDTFYMRYLVKDRMVRIDALDKNRILTSSMLVDLNNYTMVALNHERKLYKNMAVKYMDVKNTGVKVIKTPNSKRINGYTCYQWRVRNENEKTEVTYWVAKDNFNFLVDLFKVLNRTEKTYLYYLQVPQTEGYFPMQSVEMTLLREVRIKQEVIRVQKVPLKDSQFKIPVDYEPFNRPVDN